MIAKMFKFGKKKNNRSVTGLGIIKIQNNCSTKSPIRFIKQKRVILHCFHLIRFLTYKLFIIRTFQLFELVRLKQHNLH